MSDDDCQTKLVNNGEGKPAWQCPYCSHSFAYPREHEDVAKLAMVSHLARCHEFTYWQVLCQLGVKYIKAAAEMYFGENVWGGPGAATKPDCVSECLRFSP
jgi:hypothetical protein